MTDNRFNSANFDPIFSKKNKKNSKIKVDDRFKGVLTDERFASTGEGKVDKYGRKIKKDNKKAIKELSEFYEIEEEEDDDDNDNDDIEKKPSKVNDSKAKPKNEKDLESRLEYLNRLARGEVSDEDDDEEDDDDDDDEDDDDDDNDADEINDDKRRSVLDIEEEEDIDMGEATSRIAIQNCDWENLKAEDIFMVLQSFCPQGRVVKSVNIYPSDFGIQCMAAEAKYGPQGIWKEGVVDNEEESDDDMYDGIDAVDDDDNDDDYNNNKGQYKKKGKTEKGMEFQRRKGNIGIVLQDDLVRKGKAMPDNEYNARKNEEDGGIDTVALRKYELSKLRYYFAIAECDSIETANHLYDQLDMIEFGHSSMTFDLRFVPDDVSFKEREIKDSCGKIALDYKPTDFVVNALQHTDVKCTWDEGEKDREQKLTNISQWRQLNESDFQQYIASSESDSDDDKDRAKNIRKLLIGNNGEESDDEDNEDDFFIKADDSDENGEEGNMEYSYVPGMGKELLERKKEARDETPAEATRRKYLEKKKERKLARKEKINSKQNNNNDDDDDDNDDDNNDDDNDDDDNIVENKKIKNNSKKSKRNNDSNDIEASTNSAELELLFGDDDDNKDDYDMRAIVKQEKLKNKKNKNKNNKNAEASNDEFKLNTEDPRFSKLYEGDSRFGIDRTATEFKETPSMKTIFDVQRKKRTDKSNRRDNNDNDMDTSSGDVTNLVNKLKRKFQK